MESQEIIDAWLKTATSDLCDAAKERIALEIKAHFNDAVVAHKAEEQSLAKAKTLALGELGDAKAAGRRFRRKHFTIKQAAFVKEFLKEQKEYLFRLKFRSKSSKFWSKFLYFVLFIPAVLFLLSYIAPARTIYFFAALAAFGDVTKFMCQNSLQKWPDEISIKRIAWIKSGETFIVSFAAFAFLHKLEPSFWFTICILEISSNFRWVPILYKIRGERKISI